MRRSSKKISRHFSLKKGLLGFSVVVAVTIVFILPKVQAQANVPDVQILLGDEGGGHPSLPGGCGNQQSGWGTTVSESKADCMQVRINNPASFYNQDFRICLGLADGERCTPWASQGGGNSGVILNNGGFISDASIHVETQASGTSYQNVRIGVQLFYSESGSGSCGGSSGMAWADANGATTSWWAYGAQQDDDPGCAQVGLYTAAVPAYDAQYVSTTLPSSATASTAYSGTITMRNTGNSAGEWSSDNISSTNNCSTPPTALGQTCQDTQTASSSRFKLQRTDTEPIVVTPVVTPSTLTYTRTITISYSSTRTRDCEYEGGLLPEGGMAPQSKRLGQLREKIVPTAYAAPPGKLICGPYYYEWGSVTQSQSQNILPTETADFAINITTPAPAGTYHLKYRMVSNPGAFFGQEADIPITIAGSPDFSLNCDTASQTVVQGSPASYTIRANSVNNFSGQVSVTATSGMHATMSSSTVVLNVPAGGSANSPPVIISTQVNTPQGPYSLTFTATSAGYPAKTCQADLIVTPAPGPTCDISASPNPTNTNSTTLSWLIFADTAEKTSSPANASWGSSATPVAMTPADGSQGGVALTQNTTFTITAHKNGQNVFCSVPVVVNANPSFTVTPNSLSFTAQQGSAVPAAQNFTITNTGNIDLTFSVSNNKSWLSLGASSIIVPFAAGNNSRTVSVQPNTTAGLSPNPDSSTVTLNSNSTAGSTTRSVDYSLSPPGSGSTPNFTLDCGSINPAFPQSVTQGGTAQWTVPYTTSGSPTPSPINFAITSSLDPSMTKTGSSVVPPASGTVTIGTTGSTPATTYNNITIDATASGVTFDATKHRCIVSLIVSGSSPVVISFQCSSDNVSFSTGPCSVPSGGTGHLSWASQNATACSMNQSLLNYNSPAPSPPAPSGDTAVPFGLLSTPTNGLNSPTTFRLTCTAGGASASKTVTFSIIPGTPDISQSTKNIVCVTSGSTKIRFRAGLCPGAPASLTPISSYSFKAGDIVTFIIEVLNKGTADLDMSNGKTITVTDTLTKLAKPSAGWNVTYECGNGCTESGVPQGQGYVNELGNNVIQFKFTGNSASSAIPAVNGDWSITYDAVPQTPPPPELPPYRFYNCAAIVYNPNPAISSNTCLAYPYLFVQSGPNPPDRHEIAP